MGHEGLKTVLRKQSATSAPDMQCDAHRCEVTGGVGSAWPVECQEVWEFDDKQHVLRLTGMTALAPEVHLAKHILQLQGQQRASALQTLQDING